MSMVKDLSQVGQISGKPAQTLGDWNLLIPQKQRYRGEGLKSLPRLNIYGKHDISTKI